MSFCDPKSFEDTYLPRPERVAPGKPDQPYRIQEGTVGDDVGNDANFEGSRPKLDAAIADIEVALRGSGSQAARVGTNLAVLGIVGAESLGTQAQKDADLFMSEYGEQVATMRGLGEGILATLAAAEAEARRRVESAQNGGQGARDFTGRHVYDADVKAAVDVMNRLATKSLDMKTFFDGLDVMSTQFFNGVNALDGLGGHQYSAEEMAKHKADKKKFFDDTYQGVVSFGETAKKGINFDSDAAFADFMERLGQAPDGSDLNQMSKGIKGLVDGANEAAEWLRKADEFLATSQAALMAGCQLLAAVSEYINHLAWVMQNLGAILASLVANLIPGFNATFKFPRFTNLILSRVDGLRSRLAGFGAVAKCYTDLMDQAGIAAGNAVVGDIPGGSADKPTISSNDVNAFSKSLTSDSLTKPLDDMAAKIGLMVTEGLAKALAAILGLEFKAGVPNPLDAVRAAFEVKTGVTKLQPPRPVILPEEGALMAFVGGIGAIVGFATGLFANKQAETSVVADDLHQPGIDANGADAGVPVAPHGGQHVLNQCAATKDTVGITKSCVPIADDCSAMAAACAAAGRNPSSESVLANVLIAGIDGAVSALMMSNLAVDENGNNASPASRDYYACLAEHARERARAADPDITEAEANAAFADVIKGIGLPNSVATIAQRFQPEGSAYVGKVPPVSTFPTTMMPPGHYSPAYADSLKSFMDVNRVAEPELPMLLLLQDATELEVFNAFRTNVADHLNAIRADVGRTAAHARLRAASTHQGYGSTRYTYLADGAAALDTDLDVLSFLGHFLRHDRDYDVLPLTKWMTSALATEQVDSQNLLPSGLTATEGDAAIESATFLHQNVFIIDSAKNLFLSMRRRADEIGQALGYEYVVALASAMNLAVVKKRVEAGAPILEVMQAAKAVTALMPHLTHADSIMSTVGPLAGEEDPEVARRREATRAPGGVTGIPTIAFDEEK